MRRARPAGRWAAVFVAVTAMGSPAATQAPESPIKLPEEAWTDWCVPTDEELRERVKGLFTRGRSTAAMDEVMAALLRDPSQREAYTLASEMYQAIGEHETAQSFFTALTLQYPRKSHAFYYLGLHQTLAIRFGEALASFDAAIERDPTDAQSRFRRAGLLHVQARFDEALAEFRVAHELDPGSPKIATSLARALRIQGDYDSGVEILERTLSTNPNSADLHYGLAQLRQRQGRDDEVEAELRRAVKLENGHVEARRDLAALLLRTGRGDEAQTHLVRARWLEELKHTVSHLRDRMRSRPDVADYPLLLAELELVENNVDEAHRWLERAASLGGVATRILSGMAWVRIYKGDLDGARRDLARFGNHRDPHIDLSRAALLFALRQPDRAIAFVRRAVESGPRDLSFLLRAANLCRFAGAAAEARELFRLAAAAPMPTIPGVTASP